MDRGLPPDLPLGYHELRPLDGRPARPLIVAPARCHLPEGLRTWGWAVQLYALRSRESWGIGDLADLRRLAEWSAAALGAGAIVLNPLHAAAAVRAAGAEPVLPLEPPLPESALPPRRGGARRGGGRARPGAAGGPGAGARRRPPDRPRRRVPAEDGGARRPVGARGAGGGAGFAALPRPGGAGPRGVRDLLRARRAARRGVAALAGGAPAPASPAVARFAAEHAERVAFHAWLQWLLDEQLARAGRALAAGERPGHRLRRRGRRRLGVAGRAGAGTSRSARRPTSSTLEGQDWGLPPFVPQRLRARGYGPFIETVRAGLRHAGGPAHRPRHGAVPAVLDPRRARRRRDGAYVRYPTDDLLAILALESERARRVRHRRGPRHRRARRARAARSPSGSCRLASLWFEPGPPRRLPRARRWRRSPRTTCRRCAASGPAATCGSSEAVGLAPNAEGTEALRARLRELAGLDGRRVARARCRSPSTGGSRRRRRSWSLRRWRTRSASPSGPNLPGTTSDRRANWSLALPAPLEDDPGGPASASARRRPRASSAPASGRRRGPVRARRLPARRPRRPASVACAPRRRGGY